MQRVLMGRGGARGARRGRVADLGLLERRDSRATPGPPLLARGGDRVLREELAERAKARSSHGAGWIGRPQARASSGWVLGGGEY